MDKNKILKMLEQSLSNVIIARSRYKLATSLYEERNENSSLKGLIEENYTEAVFVYDSSIDEYSEVLKLYDKGFKR